MSVVSCKQLRLKVGRGEECLFVCVHRPLQMFSPTLSLSLSLSLLLYCRQSEHRTVYLDNKVKIFYKDIKHITVTPIRSNKRLLIVDREFFLSLSCQHPGNFLLTNQSDRWKELRMNCIIRQYIVIFRTDPWT